MNKRNLLIAAVFGIFALQGCQPDTGTANTTKVDAVQAAKTQSGQGGSKAARGGGVADEPAMGPIDKNAKPVGAGAKSGG